MENENDIEEKKWISLGNRQFYVEDVQSIYIQANHLIVNFDYTDKQIVLFFGHSEEGYKNCKIVFYALAKLYNAYKIPLPENVNLCPDIMKTAYGSEIDKRVRDRAKYENDQFKKRHQKKLKKALEEIEELKKKMIENV
jgi:hypothetical protein